MLVIEFGKRRTIIIQLLAKTGTFNQLWHCCGISLGMLTIRVATNSLTLDETGSFNEL